MCVRVREHVISFGSDCRCSGVCVWAQECVRGVGNEQKGLEVSEGALK